MKKLNINQIPHILFYFVCHGETNYNKDNKIMGQIDIPLNEEVLLKPLEKITFHDIVLSNINI